MATLNEPRLSLVHLAVIVAVVDQAKTKTEV